LGARILALFLAAAAASLAAPDSLSASVTRKLDSIERGQVKPGAVVRFSSAELNAWVRDAARTAIGDGLRQSNLRLGYNTVNGYALVDFLKVRHSTGAETNWLVAKLIQGEKQVVARAGLESANGRATVHLQRAEIGGLAVSGAVLDFLMRNFVLPIFPEVKIDEPFDLGYRIERIELTPMEARIYIKK